MLPRDKVDLLKQSFSEEGTPLAPSAEAALEGDLSTSTKDERLELCMQQLERLAAEEELRWAKAHADTLSEVYARLLEL